MVKNLKLLTAGNSNTLLDGLVTIPEIKRAAKKLKNNKACSKDMINNEMIKCIVQTKFIEIILWVFNIILDKSLFPHIWKIGYIVPVFKGEDSFDPSNYRGIAITSCMGKLFALILNDRLTTFLEERNILNLTKSGSARVTGHLIMCLSSVQ